MSTWNIYHKDGSKLTDVNDEQITVHGLEMTDKWMDECYVTISFKNNAPINFQIGDYLIYRNERFELNYDPGKEKQARKDSYGEAFVYDNVKFNSLQDELTRTEFLDVVLNDNELHYTALPKFNFYVQTLDDLLDRIQANLNEQIGVGMWKIFSRNKERSTQRGCTEAEWNAAYGGGTADNVIDSKSIAIDSKKCWEALALVNSEWDVNFIVRGRNVYVGTAGVVANHIFTYGLGNGLYQVDQNADSDQQIVTRLRAYGSEKNLPSHYYADLGENSLPNNMSVNRLMLPGFPHVSLQEYYDSLSETEKNYVNPDGRKHKFSTDPHRPYIDSVNIEQIGLRSGSQFFDQDDKTNGVIDIYPTIEEMVVNNVRIDEINEGVAPDDDGRFDDGQTVPNIDIYLSPSIDFDINGLKNSDFSISMKDGYCGGRTFNVASSTKDNGRWRLTIERVKDDALDLYFPYKDFPISKGDHFVLTGITLPDSYVNAASLKLLKYAIAFLDKNDYTRYVYQPKVDEIFMARQNDQANADKTGTIKSLYQTLKAGDIMEFEDTDLGIKDCKITIDQLTIKEEDGKIPTYEITLREDKEVGTMQKIQQSISSLESGNGSVSNATANQIADSTINKASKHFLSKIKDDEAQGLIAFQKGITIRGALVDGVADEETDEDDATNVVTSKYLKYLGGKLFASRLHDDTVNGVLDFVQRQILRSGFILGDGNDGLDGEGNGKLGNVEMEDVVVDRIHDKDSTPSNRVIVGAQGFDLYMGNDGKSHLYVDYLTTRTKFFAAASEVRKVSYSGGTTIFSNAGSTIVKVSYILDSTGKNVIAYKCYAAADDGTTRTMNWWHVGMMALCQTFNVKAGLKDDSLSNRYYWRMVIGVGQEILDDGKLYDFVVLSNMKTFQGNLSVLPKYSDKKLADGNSNVLKFGNVMVAVTMDDGLSSMSDIFEEQEGLTVDSGGTKVADRIFYGYEPNEDGGEPDAPQPYDVIVQIGDQIQWKKYGNVIKMSTSTEDGDTDNAPSFSMYHSVGAPYSTGSKDNDGNDIINPYQWKTMTQLLSPELELHNAANFKFFTDSPDNLIDPITVYYEIVPSSPTLIRHPSTKTATPDDITFKLVKHTGNKVETVPSDEYIFIGDGTNILGGVQDGLLFNNSILELTRLFSSTYSVARFSVIAYDVKAMNDNTLKVLASYTLTVLSDGDKGESGKNALSIMVNPDTIVFDTNDDGFVPAGTQKTVSITCMDGDKDVTSLCTFGLEDDAVNCSAAVSSDGVVAISNITSKTIGEQKVSDTSGYAIVKIIYQETVYYTQVNFSVNVSKFTAGLVASNKELKSSYTEVSNALDKMPIKTDEALTTYTSIIEQSARKISLEVTKDSLKSAGMEIASDGVTLYGDKILVKNGDTIAAAFKDGKLNADLIDAKQVVAGGIDAKQVVAEGLKAQNLDAQNATIKNLNLTNARVTGFMYNNKTVTTADNFRVFDLGQFKNIIDLSKVGNWLELGTFSNVTYRLPWIRLTDNEKYYKPEYIDYVRSLVGTKMMIYNNSQSVFYLNTFMVTEENYLKHILNGEKLDTPSIFELEPGYFVSLECKITYEKETQGNYEAIYWVYSTGKYLEGKLTE